MIKKYYTLFYNLGIVKCNTNGYNDKSGNAMKNFPSVNTHSTMSYFYIITIFILLNNLLIL